MDISRLFQYVIYMKKQSKMHVYKDKKISYMPGSPGSITNGHVTSTSIDIPHVYHAGNDVNAICEIIFYPYPHTF